MVRYFAKKYALGLVNKMMSARKDKIATSVQTIDRYENALKKVLSFLDSVKAKMADGELSSGELDAMCEDGSALVEELFRKE